MNTVKTYVVLAVAIVVLIAVTLFLVIDRGAMKKRLNNASQKSTASSGVVQSEGSAHVLGCDISHWDGDIDWLELKSSDIKFLFIKATQGSTYIDPDFDHNWASADNYGFYRGAYHFYDPKEDPKKQAEHFLSVAKPSKGDLLPVLDIEISSGVDPEALTRDITVWINTVQKAIGRYPILYTDKAFWEKAIDKDFSHCPLWIAEWEHGHPPYLPTGWSDWVFWQYSETGTVKGIPYAGKVDLDRFNGSLETLRTYRIR